MQEAKRGLGAKLVAYLRTGQGRAAGARQAVFCQGVRGALGYLKWLEF